MKVKAIIYKNENLCPVFEEQLKEAGYDALSLVLHPIEYNQFSFIDKLLIFLKE